MARMATKAGESDHVVALLGGSEAPQKGSVSLSSAGTVPVKHSKEALGQWWVQNEACLSSEPSPVVPNQTAMAASWRICCFAGPTC
jgi:hypothetical protein